MQKVYLAISFVILIIAAVFALMNNEPVSINALGLARWQSTVAVLAVVCVAAGAALMFLFDLGSRIKSWTNIRGLRKQIKMLEEERNLLKQRVTEVVRSIKKTDDENQTPGPDPKT